MARIRVIHGIDDLADDMRGIAVGARRDMVKVVREGIRVGNTVARDNAKRSSGKHGKHYLRSFTSEMKLYGALGLIVGEYGPDADMVVQGKKGAFNPGGMASGFEGGSRHSPPHNDIAKSFDLIAPAFAGEVSRTVDGWFW